MIIRYSTRLLVFVYFGSFFVSSCWNDKTKKLPREKTSSRPPKAGRGTGKVPPETSDTYETDSGNSGNSGNSGTPDEETFICQDCGEEKKGRPHKDCSNCSANMCKRCVDLKTGISVDSSFCWYCSSLSKTFSCSVCGKEKEGSPHQDCMTGKCSGKFCKECVDSESSYNLRRCHKCHKCLPRENKLLHETKLPSSDKLKCMVCYSEKERNEFKFCDTCKDKQPTCKECLPKCTKHLSDGYSFFPHKLRAFLGYRCPGCRSTIPYNSPEGLRVGTVVRRSDKNVLIYDRNTGNFIKEKREREEIWRLIRFHNNLIRIHNNIP